MLCTRDRSDGASGSVFFPLNRDVEHDPADDHQPDPLDLAGPRSASLASGSGAGAGAAGRSGAMVAISAALVDASRPRPGSRPRRRMPSSWPFSTTFTGLSLASTASRRLADHDVGAELRAVERARRPLVGRMTQRRVSTSARGTSLTKSRT